MRRYHYESAQYPGWFTVSVQSVHLEPAGGCDRTDGAETQRWTLAYNAGADVTRVTAVTAGNLVGQGISYDPHGKLLAGRTIEGIAFSQAYTARGQLRERTDLTFITVHEYNAIGLPTRTSFSAGGPTEHVYDAAHRLAEIRVNGVSLGAPGGPFSEAVSWRDLREPGTWRRAYAAARDNLAQGRWMPLPEARAQALPIRPLPGRCRPPGLRDLLMTSRRGWVAGLRTTA